jgi:membrane protease YdiL (CAAX protease family)
VSKVVVGSRAEAKAVRKAAEQAAKQAAKGMRAAGDRTRSPFAAPAAADGAATAGSASRSRAAAAPRGKSVPTARPTAGVAWGLADAAVVLAVLLLTIVAKNAVLAIPALKLMPIAGLAAVRVAVLVVYYGIQLGALTFLAGRHGSTLAESFGLSRKEGEAGGETGLANAGLVLGLLVGVEVAALSYGMAVQALGWRQPISLSSDISTVFGGGGVGLFLSALLVAVVAPVAEELAFRGVIMRSLGERWGMWPAIAVSAILFAIYHANLWLLFPMLVFGVALGWLAWTRRSLWPAIALHVAYNSLAVAAAFLVR